MSSTSAAAIEAALTRDGVPAVVSTARASSILDVRPEAVRRLCALGLIAATRPPSDGTTGRGQWRIPRTALAAYLAGEREVTL